MPRFDAIYARQSVDKKDSVSIEAQIDDCKRLCSANPRIYSDKGWSGKNVDRPDMQKLIKDIKSGIIKKVVVYKVDELTNNTYLIDDDNELISIWTIDAGEWEPLYSEYNDTKEWLEEDGDEMYYTFDEWIEEEVKDDYIKNTIDLIIENLEW